MPKENVLLTIRSRQAFEGLEEELVEQSAQGLLEKTGAGYVLTYEEPGLEGTSTVLELEEGRAVLTRTGGFRTQMVFQEGVRHVTDYETPYGKLPLGVHTLRLHRDIREAEGEVEIDYRIDLGPQQSGTTQFRLCIRRKENTDE
jgi:uncharacterized beta-barrel protein YwiB (DUF1934 family)